MDVTENQQKKKLMSIIRCGHKEQHIDEWMKEMEEVCYGNSFGHFVSAFIGGGVS